MSLFFLSLWERVGVRVIIRFTSPNPAPESREKSIAKVIRENYVTISVLDIKSQKTIGQ